MRVIIFCKKKNKKKNWLIIALITSFILLLGLQYIARQTLINQAKQAYKKRKKDYWRKQPYPAYFFGELTSEK